MVKYFARRLGLGLLGYAAKKYINRYVFSSSKKRSRRTRRRYGRRRGVRVATLMHDRKFFDENIGATASTNAGIVYNLVGSSQGTGQTNHLGDDIFLKGIKLNIQVAYNNAGTNPQYIRIMLIRGKLEKGTAPLVSDLIKSTDLSTAFAPMGRGNWYESGNWQRLVDKTYKLCNTDKSFSYQYRKYIKINRKAKYVANSTTFEDGGLYLIMLGDAALNGANFAFFARTYFSG